MKCGAARKQLYLLRKQDSEDVVFPTPAEVAQAGAHLSQCDACREFFAAEEWLKGFLRTHAPRERASAALREQVFSRIAQARAASAGRSRWFGLLRRRSIALALLSLVMIAMLMGGFWLSSRPARVMPQQLASILIDDHAHNLPSATEIASSDYNVVQSWFRGRVDFNFHLPQTREPSLIGGRLCNLQGRRAALVLFQHPQSQVSLFIFDGSGVELPEDHLIALDGKQCLVTTGKGYNVVLWKERGVVYGLVSDLRSTDLLHLAAQF